MRRIFAGLLLLAMLAGCAAREQREDPQSAVPPPPAEMAVHETPAAPEEEQPVAEDAALTEDSAAALTDFGLRLFQGCMGQKNALVSPLSVTETLAMAANGADGDTLAQMEEVFGLRAEDLGVCLRLYTGGLPDERGGSVHLANGIWINADGTLPVKPEFLQANADLYGAGTFEAPFNRETADDINAWVAENTKDRIEKIVDGLTPEAAMVLVNALSFDGEWERVYRMDEIQDGTFTTETGAEREIEMMHSTEHMYLQDEDAVGFVKYYEGRGYAFAALLPEEGVSLAEYGASLTGEKLRQILSAGEETAVEAAVPKFSAEYGTDLCDVLREMGMPDAFDSARADFSRIADAAPGEIYIDEVMHKTFISVDEKGTEAGAATAASFRYASMMGPSKTVVLDRPFLYMLIDCRYDIPLFLGAVTDIGA